MTNDSPSTLTGGPCVRAAERAVAAIARYRSANWLASLDERRLMDDARRSDGRRGAPRALEGVLIAVKDQIDVQGEVTTCGTGFFTARAEADAVIVERMRRAGCVPFGKASMCELALGPTGRNVHFGDSKNPWDPERDTGGSSSGSAALVAAGVVPLAVGTDLGGSIRIPASFCGVASLKPTFGAIPTDGVAAVSPTLEHVGFIARDVDLLTIAFAHAAGEGSASAALPPRVGTCEAWWALAQPDVARVGRAALDTACRAANAALVDVRLPSPERAGAIGGFISILNEAAREWSSAVARHRSQISLAVRVPLALGAAISAHQVDGVTRARAKLVREIDDMLSLVDVVVTPTTPMTAPRYRDEGRRGEIDEAFVTGAIAFTMPFNLSGHPAVQVPCGFDATGLPVGLQIVAHRGYEATALAFARHIERAAERRAPILRAASD